MMFEEKRMQPAAAMTQIIHRVRITHHTTYHTSCDDHTYHTYPMLHLQVEVEITGPAAATTELANALVNTLMKASASGLLTVNLAAEGLTGVTAKITATSVGSTPPAVRKTK
jgi:hypothetical protein